MDSNIGQNCTQIDVVIDLMKILINLQVKIFGLKWSSYSRASPNITKKRFVVNYLLPKEKVTTDRKAARMEKEENWHCQFGKRSIRMYVLVDENESTNLENMNLSLSKSLKDFGRRTIPRILNKK